MRSHPDTHQQRNGAQVWLNSENANHLGEPSIGKKSPEAFFHHLLSHLIKARTHGINNIYTRNLQTSDFAIRHCKNKLVINW